MDNKSFLIDNLESEYDLNILPCIDNMTNILDENIIAGIDIGERNTAITIYSNNNVICHYHYDITRGYTLKSLGRSLQSIIYDMLNETIFNKYNNIFIKIEDQVYKNRICIIIQTIIETILYMKNYKYKCINPRKKYANIKLVLGRVPLKRDLIKYIELDKSKFIFKQYNIKSSLFELKDIPLKIKYDDIIDSYLIAINE